MSTMSYFYNFQIFKSSNLSNHQIFQIFESLKSSNLSNHQIIESSNLSNYQISQIIKSLKLSLFRRSSDDQVCFYDFVAVLSLCFSVYFVDQ